MLEQETQETIDNFLQRMTDLDAILVKGVKNKTLTKAAYQQIHRQFEKVRNNATDIMNKNRILHIGIIGQVKAGKSSFLNALLFNGEDVLPRAATPMTAALTKIVYGEQEQAEVVFYTKMDWDGMEGLARRFERHEKEIYEEKYERRKNIEETKEKKNIINKVKDTASKKVEEMMRKLVPSLRAGAHQQAQSEDPEAFAAYETVKMSKKSGIDVNELPNSKIISVKNLKSDLADYVGADGEYTPFVKYLVLTLKNPLIKDLEIVDTPGLGDPIISRSEKTKSFLMECDLVFLLSVTSQFLGREDIELLERILPAESILHAVLVGTKFDDALLDNSTRGQIPLKKVVMKTMNTIQNHAEANLTQASQAQPQNKVLTRVKDSLPPRFCSALLYQTARKIEQGKQLSKDEELILGRLEKRFTGMERKPALLFALSNIPKIRETEFRKAREEKQKIIDERSENFVNDQKINFLKKLDDLEQEVRYTLDGLEKEDVSSLQRKKEDGVKALDSMHKGVRTVFEKTANEVYDYLLGIRDNINQESQKYRDLSIEEGKSETPISKEHWFKKDEHWIEVIHYKEAKVSEVLNHIDAFMAQAQKILYQELRLALDKNKIIGEIKAVALGALSRADIQDFTEDDITGPVEITLQELQLPPFRLINYQECKQRIKQKFQGAVRNEDIHKLFTEQSSALGELTDAINEKLEDLADKSKKMLDEKSVTFLDDIGKQIKDNIDQLNILLKNKEESIIKVQRLLQELQQQKLLFRGQ